MSAYVDVPESGLQDAGAVTSCFFYGTLMHAKVLARVAGADEKRVYIPAVLEGHRRHRVRGMDYPAVVPDTTSGASVRGMLVENLDTRAIERLDAFEGDEYVRRQVTVRPVDALSESPSEITCQTYIWLDHQQLLPEEWDFETFEREAIHRWTGEGGEREYSMLGNTADISKDGSVTDDGTRGRSSFR
ncbi:hypothetical protein PYCC9005_001612 [Savitreella phatthalungensis]